MTQTLQARNMEIVRSMSANGFAGRMDLVEPHVSEALIVAIPGSMPHGGEYRGWQGYLGMLGKFVEQFKDFAFAPIEVAATGCKVFILSELTGTVVATGKAFRLPFTEVWELQDEKVVKITPFFYDTKAMSDISNPGT